jgi:hypothetical protein
MTGSNGPQDAARTSPADHLVPEAGGHPARLAGAAAEYVRAANHATINAADVLNPGLLSGMDAYDAVAELSLLASRLPQLCRQLAAVLDAAAGHGTLTGPRGAAELAATHLRWAAETLTAAYQQLDAATQTLGPVGGWLSPDAEARADQEARG